MKPVRITVISRQIKNISSLKAFYDVKGGSQHRCTLLIVYFQGHVNKFLNLFYNVQAFTTLKIMNPEASHGNCCGLTIRDEYTATYLMIYVTGLY